MTNMSGESAQHAEAVSLPVKQVVVYRNGVGYFAHEGEVDGTQEISLSVAEEDVNDLLGSLVVSDPGGRAPAVRFPARDPLQRILASYSIDLNGSFDLPALLRQARGERVTVSATDTVSGRIISVDVEANPRGPERTLLSLAGADGLRRVDLSEITTIRFENQSVQQDLDAALEAIAGSRVKDERDVRVSLSGLGTRTVGLAYVRPMPVWKCAYRLVLSDDGYADLQGWAIVDNPTSTDLVDVEISVVSGDPMSFITNLAEPRHVVRPIVGPAVTESIVPQSYRAGSAMPAAAGAGDWSQAEDADYAFARSVEPMAVAMKHMEVEPEVDSETVGLNVAYTVREPVTIPRFSSAMIPILQHRLPATRISVFDEDVDDTHPMRGVLLRNDSEVQVAAGPVTVFDGAYAGTAQLEDLLAGTDQILTYARDLAVNMFAMDRPARSTTRVSLVDGMLRSTTTRSQQRQVVLGSDAPGDRLVMVVHTKPVGTKVTAPGPKPVEQGNQLHFGVLLRGRHPDAPGDDAGALPVQEESEAGEQAFLVLTQSRRDHTDRAVVQVGEAELLFCIENGDVTPAEKKTLKALAEVARERTEVRAGQKSFESRRHQIEQDQTRIRGNLQGLDQQSSLYKRYLSELNAQEDELAGLTTRQKTATEQLEVLEERARQLARALVREA